MFFSDAARCWLDPNGCFLEGGLPIRHFSRSSKERRNSRSLTFLGVPRKAPDQDTPIEEPYISVPPEYVGWIPRPTSSRPRTRASSAASRSRAEAEAPCDSGQLSRACLRSEFLIGRIRTGQIHSEPLEGHEPCNRGPRPREHHAGKSHPDKKDSSESAQSGRMGPAPGKSEPLKGTFRSGWAAAPGPLRASVRSSGKKHPVSGSGGPDSAGSGVPLAAASAHATGRSCAAPCDESLCRGLLCSPRLLYGAADTCFHERDACP